MCVCVCVCVLLRLHNVWVCALERERKIALPKQLIGQLTKRLGQVSIPYLQLPLSWDHLSTV